MAIIFLKTGYYFQKNHTNCAAVESFPRRLSTAAQYKQTREFVIRVSCTTFLIAPFSNQAISNQVILQAKLSDFWVQVTLQLTNSWLRACNDYLFNHFAIINFISFLLNQKIGLPPHLVSRHSMAYIHTALGLRLDCNLN